MKINWLFIAPLVVGVMSAGCVSTSKYKKLETDLNSQLKQMSAKNASLDQELAKVKQENSVLNQEKADMEKKSAETKAEYDNVVLQLSSEAAAGQLKISQYQNMLKVDLAEEIFFNSGSAKLKKTGKEVLLKVAAALVQYNDKIIRVVGHTDNVPIVKVSPYPTNWELSIARATNVVRFLQDEGKIPGERLVAAGQAEYAPVAPNDTEEGRQKNRRIEIMLLDKSLVTAMQEKK